MILQQELELSHKENIKNLDNLAKSVEAQKKIEYFRDQMTNKNNQLKTQIQKFEDENADLSIKLKVSANRYTQFAFISTLSVKSSCHFRNIE